MLAASLLNQNYRIHVLDNPLFTNINKNGPHRNREGGFSMDDEICNSGSGCFMSLSRVMGRVIQGIVLKAIIIKLNLYKERQHLIYKY
jgi:hypothetical protein